MFSYYGSKSKIVDCYPPPKFDKVIEPFAGSARYALKYWQKEVLLVDKYESIVVAWNFLINASEKDILTLPKMKLGDSLDDFDISYEEKKFMGFMVQSSSGDRKTLTSFMADVIDANLKKISENLFKIRHWKVKKGCYTELENIEATWFVDPPYQFGGEHYKEPTKNIDFNHLSNWCKNRNGQVIVCENTKADWMDFKPMVDMQGAMFKTTEAIWSNLPTNYDNVQQTLF